MSDMLHVEILPRQSMPHGVRVAARVSGNPRPTKRNGIVYFDVPEDTAEWLPIQDRADDRHDAFARAMLWSALEAGLPLRIHGRVSQTLLRNLERYQQIASDFWPEQFQPCEIQADEEIADSPANSSTRRPREALLAFSGGLDSSESLLAHARGLRGRNTLPITTCLFVEGFDIPVDDPTFPLAFARAKPICDSVQIPLRTIRTNLKTLLPPWILSHPAGVMAALSLWERKFDTGVMGSTHDYLYYCITKPVVGCFPMLDALLSSDTFQTIQDLCDNRARKTERIKDSAVVWQNIRVCWKGVDLSKNCGHCEKCIRQMLTMRAVGLTDLSAYERPLTVESILAVSALKLPHRHEWTWSLRTAERNGLSADPVFVATAQVLARESPRWDWRAYAARRLSSIKQRVRNVWKQYGPWRQAS